MKKKWIRKLVSGILATAMLWSVVPQSLIIQAAENTPAALGIGHPTFKNAEYLDELYDIESLGVEYSDNDIMMAIYESDLANGGDSFYIDRILAREGVADGDANTNGNNDGNTFLTRGRALYMYTSNPSVIGFGGNTAYYQPFDIGNMYSITFLEDGETLTTNENVSDRINYPSNWVSSYNIGDTLEAEVTKFISQENVAVTAITLNNTSGTEQSVTVKAASAFVSEKSEVEINGKKEAELIGTRMAPSNLTEVTMRLTGSGFIHSDKGSFLTKDVTISAGESVEIRVVMAFTAKEIPASQEDYIRFSEYETNLEAIRAQKAEYNLYWAENLPYIDVPNDAVQKAIDYRWWLERYNTLDANIPGYDFQYPVTIEGVLGYNNAIALTQPMHLQDTKWLRSAYIPYGQLLSVGNSSQSSAFLDNPGNRAHWNNHYGQYIAEAGLEAFYVIGGSEELAEDLAYYFEHDAKGQLDHYGNHTKYDLIAYQGNYMTGNDSDTISMSSWSGVGQWKIHGENAYVWAAADSAAQLYDLVGDYEKADEMYDLADSIQEDVLNVLWCEECEKFETYGVSPTQTLHNQNQPNLVKWTESNNWNYFSVGLVPTDEASLEKYRPAFEAFTNGEEFPIFPYYTANLLHNNEHIAVAGYGGTNNFSNINFTVQARIYESALRTYDKEQTYITDDMLALMVEWGAWNMYPDGGDVRYPNNNEFFNIDNKTLETYYRSWIYHNILGNYNYIFFEDMAGIVPRMDDKIELSPIDFSYDRFMVNNARYHGHDLTIVWDDPNDNAEYYDDVPSGYSLYIDGERAFTLNELASLIYDPEKGTIEFTDEEAEITYVTTASEIPDALDTVIKEEKVLELFEKSGIHGLTNVAEGANVEAAYTPATARAASWEENHRANGYDETSKAVNEIAPDPQAVTDGMTVNMPFWGNYESPNAKDSLVITLDKEQTVDMATLYFYNDRQSGGYSEPAKFSVEYWDGSNWKPVENQVRTPDEPEANYNKVFFKAVTTDQFRFTFTNKDGYYTSVTEIQLFEEGGERQEVKNSAPTVQISEATSKRGNLRTSVVAKVDDDGRPYEYDASYYWEVISKPSKKAAVTISTPDKLETVICVSEAGEYMFAFTADDDEYQTSELITVTITESEQSVVLANDVAPDAIQVESDHTADWENLYGINNENFEPVSSNAGNSQGWGNWPQEPGSEHYVGYIWDEPVTVSGFEVYWYDDVGGTRIPGSFWLEYLDENGDWVEANIQTSYEDAIEVDTYNTVYFDTITTTNLRLYMTVLEGYEANGIYRLKVYEAKEIAYLDTVEIATEPGVMPTLPQRVYAWTENGELVSAGVIWDALTDSMIQTEGKVTINGINSESGLATTATIYVRNGMDAASISTVQSIEVATSQGKIPELPKTVKVGYNNGAQNMVAVSWPEITADMISEVGDVTINGEVNGTTKKALLTIHVLDASVDKTSLKDLIETANDLDPEGYTDESWADLSEVLQMANEIYRSISSTQDEINQAIKQLASAIENLEILQKEKLPYVDVAEKDWFYEGVYYNYVEKTMTGMDETHFGPYGDLSRAQFALILYRMEGEPTVSNENTFKDIVGNEWYADAVLWAQSEGIVTGYVNGNFGPADLITREQIALMMYRYAGYLGKNTAIRGDISGFEDADSVSGFALDAFRWAYGLRIITGKENGTKLDPQGNTARSEAAVIIQRYMERY